MLRTIRTLVSAPVLVGTLLAADVGGATATPMTPSRPALENETSSARVKYRGVKFHYKKRGCVATGCGSRHAVLVYVYDKLYFRDDGYPPVVSRHRVSWRAGSGAPSRGKNDCAVGHGWIPNTKQPGPNNRYRLRFYDRYAGGIINGTALAIRNKTYGGALVANCDGDRAWERSELFIHSEMTVSGGQSCGGGDRSTCWEGSHDYYSAGCIKVAYRNMRGAGRPDRGTVAWHWRQRGGRNGIPLVVTN